MHLPSFGALISASLAVLLASPRSMADEAPDFTVTRMTLYQWFTCQTCDPIQVHPLFMGQLAGDGTYTTVSDCLGTGQIFAAEWGPNSVRMTTLIDTRQRCWECLGAYTCNSCAWGLMGPMWDGFVFRGNKPFFLPMFTEYSPEGAFQIEPALEHESGWGGMPEGYVFRFTACREDFDASGEVDFADISTLLLSYGSAPGGDANWYPRLDLDGSETVDNGDLALELLGVGPCPW